MMGLILLVIFISGFKLFFIQYPLLYIDEALTWLLVKNSGFHSHDRSPLMLAFSEFFIFLGGNTEFSIRVGFVLVFIFSTYLMYVLAKQVSGRRQVGIYAAFLFNILPIFAVESILAVPEVLEVLFSLLFLIFLIKAIREEKIIWWVLAGIFLGAGILSRYSMLALIPILSLSLITSASCRKWLNRKEPYFLLMVALLMNLPNLLWSFSHHGGAYEMALFTGLSEELASPSFKGLFQFLFLQSFYVSPLYYFIFLTGIPVMGWQAFKSKKDSWRLLFLSYVLPLCFLSVLSIFTQTGADTDWLLQAFFAPIIFVSMAFDYFSQRKGKLKFVLGALAIISSAASLIITGSAYGNMIAPVNRWLYSTTTPGEYNRMYGWPEMAARAQTIRNELASETKKVIFLSADYYLLSELAFYAKINDIYLAAWKDRPGAARDFELWGKTKLPKEAVAVYIETSPMSDSGTLFLGSYYPRIEKLEPLSIYKNGILTKTFYFYKCYPTADS